MHREPCWCLWNVHPTILIQFGSDRMAHCFFQRSCFYLDVAENKWEHMIVTNIPLTMTSYRRCYKHHGIHFSLFKEYSDENTNSTSLKNIQMVRQIHCFIGCVQSLGCANVISAGQSRKHFPTFLGSSVCFHEHALHFDLWYAVNRGTVTSVHNSNELVLDAVGA